MKKIIMALCLLSSQVVHIAHAAADEELTGTLKKIKEKGVLVLGVRDSTKPFSYLNDKQSYEGYAVDLCLAIAKNIQRKLGMSQLNISMLPVTSSSRIPLIQNGTVDIECGNTTNTAERQNIVEFSPTYYVSGSRILSKRSSNITTLADLRGKKLAINSGTTHIKMVSTLNDEQKLGIDIIASRDTAEGMLLVETGRAAAFINDDIVLASLAGGSKISNELVVGKEALSVEPFGLIYRKNDPAFKQIVDTSISTIFKSGDINKIYAKWFQSPALPHGQNLNWPMSPETQAAIAKISNSPNPADYAPIPKEQLSTIKKK
ncbi:MULTISPECIES: amino acid ABC transporter substrate-binding protein [unclassified Herbaspirillum]|uniref:amino acid ABC transporter substrate-binding protein n=1 Tax=unclassified Herbaspirillum TaxID=2624150 RepID=UPI000E2FD32E|nr:MULTISPECIES: amino acid ABC transporter substrate-binding protein [unclassified Herbaspirillum]RFB71189.1 amino acid ABC transporter substrate-binding protein [Herbaspirillum sp. 3R-3a1]TFI08274.1 amino acid ABC transporter substrate-binding protein [Herbaspirillum sp. 3R11]TFI14689.1 amino acid ABC transporter substrate-binding protein [Herbaspirillum sp. 3R-11]TFI31919.1 amino acid ABC transporter substrate-binding protein [Herbaspirillum sp. 3C11]TFI31998.1 amino acid ABC transporter su